VHAYEKLAEAEAPADPGGVFERLRPRRGAVEQQDQRRQSQEHGGKEFDRRESRAQTPHLAAIGRQERAPARQRTTIIADSQQRRRHAGFPADGLPSMSGSCGARMPAA